MAATAHKPYFFAIIFSHSEIPTNMQLASVFIISSNSSRLILLLHMVLKHCL